MALSTRPSYAALVAHAQSAVPPDLPSTAPNHLRQLTANAERAAQMTATFKETLLDYSRSRANADTMRMLQSLARECGVQDKIKAMAAGEHINTTEDRAVLHMALRCARDSKRFPQQTKQVWEVLDCIFAFAKKVREGRHAGATQQPLTHVVSIGIGGSYLGPEFVHEALRWDAKAHAAAQGRSLRFLANVDPVDVARALEGLDPARTLVVVVSKTFTTAETMLNARTVRKWLVDGLKSDAVDEAAICRQHIVAVSADVPKAQAFGVAAENVFGFWDWVGGRYSVCSAVGMLPLSLQYGAEVMQAFLQGARDMDEHFMDAEFKANLPVLLGAVAVWNHQFLGYPVRAVLPYSQALLRFPAHIQQVSMESNGKGVASDGAPLGFASGEVIFGEPGTNGQHSFYQLIHQGRVVPCDFIGVCQSQAPVDMEGEAVSNHDELMSNFFAQPDALARGKTADELRGEGVHEHVLPHKVFKGDRPSVSLLLPRLDAEHIGQLLALYEDHVAVQGFFMGVNSFDQWGVELGKVLATAVRGELSARRKQANNNKTPKIEGSFVPSTKAMLERYLAAAQ